MSREMRVRISTVFLMIAVAFFPLHMGMLPSDVINPFGRESTIGYYWDWVVYFFSPGMFSVAIILALVFVVWFAFKKQWHALIQHVTEIIVCLAFSIFIPVY